MNTNLIQKVKMSKIGGLMKVVGYHLKKVRPEVFLILGIGGVAAGTVMACKKMKDAQPIIDHAKEQLEELKFVRENTYAEEKPGFKEYARVFGRAGYELGRVFLKPGVIWIGGMACIVGSHGDLRTQNGKLLADGVALKTVFDEYRKRVIDKIGEEEEKLLYFGAEDREIETEDVDDSTGEVKKKTSKEKVFVNNPGSIWARKFTAETSPEFMVRSAVGRESFINAKEDLFNREIKMQPFIVINEIYDSLNLQGDNGKCPEGMTVGWTRGEEIKIYRLEGWDEVWDPVREKKVLKKCMILDFNCHPLDGLI